MTSTPPIRPLPGFDLNAVSWGAPDDTPATTCSYCDAPIADDDMPLVVWNRNGWCARFCDSCQARWWGAA